MDAVIAKILDIEERSRGIVREAEEKRDSHDEIIDAKKKELRASIYAAAEKRFQNDKQLVLNKAKNEAAEQDARARVKISEMESFAQQHREEWLNTLYSRITGIK